MYSGMKSAVTYGRRVASAATEMTLTMMVATTTSDYYDEEKNKEMSTIKK